MVTGNDNKYILCEDIFKIYKIAELEVVALRGLDLEVNQGEVLAIVGASGSGKSTLLDCVSGFTTPDHGAIKLGDRFLCQISGNYRQVIPAESRRIGYMFQRGFLFPH